MMNRKLISLIMSTVMALSMLAAMPAVSFAGKKSMDSLTATRGVYWFDPHEVSTDLTDTFVYDDSLLTGDSLEYDQRLATMSYELAIASISSEREEKTVEGYQNKSRNLRAYLEDNGFVDFDTNRYYKEKMTTETMGAACAHKEITDGGKKYTLLAIVPRSAGYEAEWGGNFQIGEEGDHEGFKKGKTIVLDFAKEYVEKYGITGDIKVWTAGYSRGGGVTNQVAAALIKDAKTALGRTIDLEPSDIYCYTFGTPNSAASPEGESGTPTDSKFDYIHNTWEGYDIVTIAPPQGFGFNRYGTNTGYAKAENKERMLEFLSLTNSKVYDIYMNGGDPDGFSPKTIDLEKLINNKQFSLADDENSYIDYSQKEFLLMMSDSIVAAVGTRQVYYDRYQTAFSHLTGYVFSHMGDLGKVIDGVKANKYSSALVAMLYISYMFDRYSETNFDADTIDEIQKAINMLNGIIKTYEDNQLEVPEHLKTYVEELNSKLSTANTWNDAKDLAWNITRILYSSVMTSGLTNAGLDQEDQELFTQLTDKDECKAVSRLVAYILLYDTRQSESDKIISFTKVTKQMKHLATFAGNASRYMRPHNNEVILSWLRTLDPTYDDFSKENSAQIAGYRRVYITKPEGAVLTGEIRDSSGGVAATFKDGKITSRTDKWIGFTTSDIEAGGWLRIPADDTYTIIMNTDEYSRLGLKVAEYSVYNNEEVRTVEGDSNNRKWSSLTSGPHGCVSLVLPKLEEGFDGYDMTEPSDVKYRVSVEEHSWSVAGYTPATCETPGTKQYRCTVCSSRYSTTIPATGHKWGEWRAVEGGDSHERVCQNDPSHKETEPHVWEVVQEDEPTYISAGKRISLCRICGATSEESIPALEKEENTLDVKAKKVTIKASKLKKKAVRVARRKALKITGAQGQLTYKKVGVKKKKFAKKITVNKKTGKITVKKGLKKGTYRLKIQVTAAGTTVYKPASKTVIVKIRVRK